MENLFDTRRDTLHNDEAFTPEGDRHWTHQKMDSKMNLFWKTVSAMGVETGTLVQFPAVIGLAEIENEWVLRTLCRSYPLGRNYAWLHFESPDARGVDCAMLYDKNQFIPFDAHPIRVSDSSVGFFTRDILAVGGVFVATGDTAFLFVCHFPSRLGGEVADRRRVEIANRLRGMMDSLSTACPRSLVLAMGDFNSDPRSEPMRRLCDEERVCNMMSQLPRGEGSYKYQGQWDYLDQIVYCGNGSRLVPVDVGVLRHPALLVDDPRYQGVKPKRTYNGFRYQGGLSDHLPVYVDLLSVR